VGIEQSAREGRGEEVKTKREDKEDRRHEAGGK
jgi:hypothetical protein